MKRLLPLILFLVALGVNAQHYKNDRHKRIKTLKVAFITEKLSLTQDEAQKFWPIYNSFDENTSKIKFQDLRQIRKEIRQGMESITENKANDLLNRFMEAENSLHKERVLLVKKLKGIIPSKKIILLKSAEDEFNRKMLEQYRKRKGDWKKNHP